MRRLVVHCNVFLIGGRCVDRLRLRLGPLLTLILDHANLLIKQFLIVEVQIAANLVVSAAITGTLDLELVLVT